MAEETVSMSVVLVKDSGRAYLIDHGGDENVWVPKSQVTVHGQCQGLTTIELPVWLATEKEMV